MPVDTYATCTPEDQAIVTVEAPDFRKGEGERCRIQIGKREFLTSSKLDPASTGQR